jgi:hypothetical protein
MPIFEAEIGKITQSLIEKRFLKKEYYEQLGKQADLLQAETMYDSFTRTIDNVSPFFVLSFCRHAKGTQEFEHGLLSQWRGYTGSGGFAIEFDEQLLDELATLETKEYAFAGYKSENVEYEDHKKVFNADDYTGVVGEMTWHVFDAQGLDVVSVTGRKDADEAVLKFAQTAPFLKHWGFHEESEYRIVMLCLRPSKMAKQDTRPPKEIKVRHRESELIPYIELFGTFQRPLPIKSIIVGPHARQERQSEVLRMFLESKKLKIEVRSSQIPFRR